MTTAGQPVDHAQRALRLSHRLHHWAAASVQASRPGQELSLRQLGALIGIREGRTSPGALARRLRVTPAVVAGMVDRLVRQGHVWREADPDGRRRLWLALTESGLAVSRTAELALAESLAVELAAAGAPELEGLRRALDLLERALAALETRTPGSADGGSGAEDTD
ncbi:MarR family winged helix-turn-helix transcriptional regulator [Sorangium cellulosum]|uniref:HTH marR-type domain-containing protein n=1 Tax=Sorangium cellulosum TaxID=56 RepID=A0A150QLD7_SORCE|nr:MarR family winged helix-turn-helix transcriptional regulator [Sorangium cellulosum]KYF68774.1 hypothetical protein BE15_08755 [Sorangium cellulosum]